MTNLTDKLRAMAALRRGAPLHDASATEAAWLEQVADELERRREVIQGLWAERDDLRAAIHRVCTAYPDDDVAPTCVAVLREAMRELLAAECDCRTCRHFRGTQHCDSVLRCVDGSSYQRGGVVQLWEAAPVSSATL